MISSREAKPGPSNDADTQKAAAIPIVAFVLLLHVVATVALAGLTTWHAPRVPTNVELALLTIYAPVTFFLSPGNLGSAS
jgi:hypothetical protein